MSSPPVVRPATLVYACLAATWLIWGSTYLAIKWALVSFPPFLQMGTRFLFAGFVLLAWMRILRGAPWPTRAQWRHALWVGTLMLGGGMGLTAYAEQTVGSGLVVAFVGVVPIMIAAMNAFWQSYPSRREVAGIAVGVVGVTLLARGAGFGASPVGLATMALACATWSIGSVLSQRRWALAPGATGFASEMICGGAVLMAMAGAAGEFPTTLAQWPFDRTAVLAWFYLVIFGSLIAFNAYMVLLARAPAALASSYSFVNPLIAMVLGVAVGGETVTAAEWCAALVIVLGVILLLAGRRQGPSAGAESGQGCGRAAAARRERTPAS